MAMNSSFLTALHSIYRVAEIADLTQRAQHEKMRDDALDAVLKSDPSNTDEFRKAVSDHNAFWTLFLSMQGAVDSSQLLDPNDSDPQLSFSKLHQKAAEERVRANLYKVDNQVLIAILANNPDECRAYLADKTELGLLKNAKGWLPNVTVLNPTTNTQVPAVPPQNKSVAVLPDEAIKQIQQFASIYLLNNLIFKSTDKVALKQLLDASNQSELNAAMQALGFPQQALSPPAPIRITHPLNKLLSDNFKGRELEVRQTWAKDNFETYVKNLPIDQLLGKKEALEATTLENYRKGLGEIYKNDLSEPDLKDSIGILGARYLQVVISQTEENENFLTALNANDSDLVNAIGSFEDVRESDYIAAAVKFDAPGIRQGLLQRFISSLDTSAANIKLLSEINSVKTTEDFIAGLRKLGITNVDWINKDEWKAMQAWSHAKAVEMVQEQVLSMENTPANQATLKNINLAATLDEFKGELIKIGIDPVDWVTNSNRIKIQNTTRNHAFKMHIEDDKFGELYRPELLKALNQLPQKKQEALLEKPQQLRHLLHAKDANAVKFYLGRDAKGINEVVQENTRLAGFQKLHNVPLAKALANCRIGISLNAKQIVAINKIIKDEGGSYTDVDKYKSFVDKISAVCTIPTPNREFYRAFDLNDDGSALISAKAETLADPIINQHAYNAGLYNFTANSTDISKKMLVDLLLRVEKKQALSDAHINKIDSYFKSSKDVNAFLKKISEDSEPAIKSLKTGIQNELPAILFNQLKIQSLATPLRGKNTPQFNNSLKMINEQLDGMTEARKSFSDSADKLKFLADVDQTHLAAPQFVRESKDDPDGMRAKFEDLADKCDAIVDKLLRNRSLIKAQLASIPTSKTLPQGPFYFERWNRIRDLKDDLQEEQIAIEESLKTFQDYQTRLSGPSGILKAIDDAIAGKKNDYYEPATFTTSIVKAGNSITTAPPVAATSIAASASLGSSGKVNNFLTGDRLEPGDKCEYKMDHTIINGQPPTTFRAQGQFTESYDQTDSPAPSKLKDGKIKKQEERTFNVDQIPTQIQLPSSRQTGSDPRLKESKVNFYMGMAVAIVACFDPSNPPSKGNPIRMNGVSEQEMRHLWTALVVLGEKNEKNMRFKRDVIIVESGPFNPANERGRFGFTSESLYKSYKKEHENTVTAKVTDAQGMAKRQTEHIKAEERAEKGIEKFKKGLSDMKTKSAVAESEKDREEEGAAPETPSVGFKH
ncbi:interaptin [Legionella antarctica]|uniref:Interaptin n=1 Tax=Legionella antarctica TaxID=2708020 RepID=A0A6F8T259_9GAMM|nr:hypothetical protein [Legionella antarctica]BCA94551.1 interaptin [Legionella antarctica]